MIFVQNKHRYFRIQVIVSVAISMAVYLAAKAGLIGASNHSSPAQSLGLPMFTLGPVLAACVLVYFQRGALRLSSVIGFAILLYGVVLVWPFVIASGEGSASFNDQEALYFTALNFVGFLIFGGVTAWLGKLVGILTLAAFSFSAYSGSSELLVLSPVLAFLKVTSPIAQWTVAIVITVGSFLADR